MEPGDYEAIFKYDDVLLASGAYPLVIGLSSYEQSFYYKENVTSVEISQISELTSDSRILRNTGVGKENKFIVS